MAPTQQNFVATLASRMKEARPLIQVVLGPRQVGKTTGVQQLLADIDAPHHYASADQTLATPQTWILEQWQQAREKGAGTILVIDEIQKIHNWSEMVKKLWDEEPKRGGIKPILLGSSSIKLQHGLTESLTGRFETIRVFHWSYTESQKVFGCSLNDYLIFGGYPGAYAFMKEPERWLAFVRNSIIETVIGQDILSVRSVKNPALFRQAFEIISSYPAQEISYTKLLGQLQDKGNTDLIKHYLHLYEEAFLFKALSKFSGKVYKTKSSSPKLLPLCPALYTVSRGHTEALEKEERGRIFEMIVGADLVRDGLQPMYWREANNEVDYVLKIGPRLYALEVKSGRKKSGGGVTAFLSHFPKAKPIFITSENYETFALSPKRFLENQG